VIAGDGGLPERFDLTKRYFGEGHRAFVFVEHLGHGCPQWRAAPRPVFAAIIKIIATKLKEENERPVNGLPPGFRSCERVTLRPGRGRAVAGTPEDASDRPAPMPDRAAPAAPRRDRSKACARPEEGPAA